MCGVERRVRGGVGGGLLLIHPGSSRASKDGACLPLHAPGKGAIHFNSVLCGGGGGQTKTAEGAARRAACRVSQRGAGPASH